MTHSRPRIDKFGHVHPPRHGVPVWLFVTVAVLLAVGFLAYQGLDLLIASINRYQPPALSQIEAAGGTTPVAERAVLIIVSGLRDDVSHTMPALDDLRQKGARARAQVPWPATSQTAWITLLSGATPEFSGATALPESDAAPSSMAVDHLLRRARVARHTTALIGHEQWRTLIGAGEVANTIFSTSRTRENDVRLVEQAVDMLATNPPELAVIQLSQVDAAGEIYGGASDEYYRAAQRADELIRRLTSVVDLQNTVLAVTSDRGYRGQSGPGETETAVVEMPLIVTGPGVKSGEYGVIDQIDVAPTLAALLGLPIPAESQGAIRFEMLDIEMPLQAQKAIALAGEQIRLSDAYLRATDLGALSGTLIQKLDVARSAWDIGNIQGAFEIARQGEQGARQEMSAGRSAKITEERRGRFAVALGAGALFLSALLLLMSKQTAWLLGASLLAWVGPLRHADALAILLDTPAFRWAPAVIGAILALASALRARRSKEREHLIFSAVALGAGLLFTCFQLGSFSPSIMANMETLRTTMIWRAIAALLVSGGAVISWMRPEERDWGRIARVSYWGVFLLLASLILQLAIGYWLLGLRVTWYLPDADLIFWQVAGLLQTTLIAGLGILLPALVLLATFVLRWLRRQPSADPGVQASGIGEVHP